ncbi:MAG: hypothetical protein ACRC2T_07135 [Thermoguttaceae bacterium]
MPRERKIERRNAKAIITQAINNVNELNTIDAEIRLKVNYLGSEFTGNGVYLDKKSEEASVLKDSSRLFQLVLRIQPTSVVSPSDDSGSSTLKVVCNGRDIWKYTSIEGEKRLQRIELSKLKNMLAKSKSPNLASELGQMSVLGGIVGTLCQLEKIYDFDNGTVESGELGSGDKAFPVWKVSVPISEKKLNQLTKQQNNNSKNKKGSAIPSSLVVYLGQEDFFPYRLEYFQGPLAEIHDIEPMIRQDFVQVALNKGDISESLFEFRTPDHTAIPDDMTQSYFDKLQE